MRELQQKQRTKKRLYSIPVLIVISIVVIFLLKGTYQVIQKDISSSASLRELEAKTQAMADRKAELKSNIERLNTDVGVDAEIKDKFSVSKPGEHVAVIVDERNVATSTMTTSLPWYKRLLSVLGL